MKPFKIALSKGRPVCLPPKGGRLLSCALCGSPWMNAGGLCRDCEKKLPKKPEDRRIFGIKRTAAALCYEEPAIALVHRFKYQNCRYLAEFFALHMAGEDDFPKGAVLIPVPLHPNRQRQRGFSQTAELCAELSRMTGRRAESALLARSWDTPPQTGLPLADRRANLKGAFTAGDAKGISVILVDDVITSGATLGECANTLNAAGAKAVYALCACSVDNWEAQ